MMNFFEGMNDKIKKCKEESKPDPLIEKEDRAPTHLDSAKTLILQTLDDLAGLKTMADGMEVTNPDQSKTAMEMILQSKRILNALEAQRKKITRPNLDFLQEVNAFAKEYQIVLQGVFNDLSSKRQIYEKEVERKAQEVENKRLEAEKKLIEEQQKKAQDALKSGQLPPVTPPSPPPPAAPLPLTPKIKEVCEDGIAVKKTSWKWEVVNGEEIPRGYLVLNEVLINEEVKAGTRTIPGLRIFEHTETTYRAKPAKKRRSK